MLDKLVPFSQLLWFQKVSIFLFDLFSIFAWTANNFAIACNSFGHFHPWSVELINFSLHTWLHNPIVSIVLFYFLTYLMASRICYICVGESVLQKCLKVNFLCVYCFVCFWYIMYGSFDIYQCFVVRFRVSELTVCSIDH